MTNTAVAADLALCQADAVQTPTSSLQRAGLVFETFANDFAGSGQRRVAACVCVAATLGFVAVLPKISAPMPTIPGFLALNQSALVFVYGLTTWLLLAQYRRSGCPSLLVLGAGLFYTTLIVSAQLVCFPNLLQPGLALGQGPATLTWLWSFWHFGVPIVALPFAIMEGDGRKRQTKPKLVGLSVWLAVTAVLVGAMLTTLATTQFVEYLPVTADPDGGYWTLTTSGIGPILIGMTALALAVLCWTTRLRTVLQLWFAVSLFVLLLDNLTTDLGANRATMGWFVGRLDALLAGIVVLGVYVVELNSLHRRAEATAVDREAARVEAQAAREHLEIVLEASGMGNWELDLTNGRSRQTLRHDRVFGYNEPQLDWNLARFLEHVLHEDRAGVEAAFARALQGGSLELECRIRRVNDDAIRWITLHGRASFNQVGQPALLAGCILDGTERRINHERLKHAEHMEALGQLTGGLAHDFNNLLTIILGNLEMIVRRPGDMGRVERMAQSAFAAGRRGSELTEKLLVYSRRQAVRPETVNLNRLAAELEPLLQQALGAAISVEMDLDPQADPVRLDPGQFQAALLNLAGNARDAMPSGGHLRLETRNVELTLAQIADLPEAKPGSYLRVELSDTGTGMDPSTAARAFEPFFTTKEVGKGTGLGLSQVYGFVSQAGGISRIKTAPGEGCSIQLYLPRSTGTVSSEAVVDGSAGQLRPAINGEVVLVVEDDAAVREMASESLESLGYSVITAPDARVALNILRGPSRVDILFSDVVMPGGMNGAQLAVQARSIRPETKVLLASGYTNTSTGGTRELPDGIPLLRKPYLREELAEQLHSVLAR